MPPKIADALALEEAPALHEELAFLPLWKRAVYASGATASWLTAVSLAFREIPGLGPASTFGLAGLLVLLGGAAAWPAAQGAAPVTRPGRLDRVALAGTLFVALLALADGLWLGALAMVLAFGAGRHDLARLEASFAEAEETPGELPPSTP